MVSPEMKTILRILAIMLAVLSLSPVQRSARAGQVGVAYLYTIGGPSLARRFERNAPLFLERAQRELYVLDGNYVYIYNSDGIPEFDFVLRKQRTNHMPISIVADDKGNIYVLQYGTDSQFIEMYDFRGNYLGIFELKGYPENGSKRRFSGLDLDSNMRFYVTDSTGMDLLIFDQSGKYLGEISSRQEEFPGRGRGSRFDDIDFDKEEFAYLLDYGTAKVFVYDRERKFVLSFGERGGTLGKFSQPVSLAVDHAGEFVYVADTTMHAVSVFTAKGKYVGVVGTFGSGLGQFYFPKRVVTDNEGHVYVLDLYHGIQVFKKSE